MNNQNLRMPFVIYDGRTGFSLISSVSRAADFLFANHKEYGSPAWSDAIDCCSRVKLGVSTPEQVSTAFIATVPAPGSGSIPRAPLLISATDFSP